MTTKTNTKFEAFENNAGGIALFVINDNGVSYCDVKHMGFAAREALDIEEDDND